MRAGPPNSGLQLTIPRAGSSCAAAAVGATIASVASARAARARTTVAGRAASQLNPSPLGATEPVHTLRDLGASIAVTVRVAVLTSWLETKQANFRRELRLRRQISNSAGSQSIWTRGLSRRISATLPCPRILMRYQELGEQPDSIAPVRKAATSAMLMRSRRQMCLERHILIAEPERVEGVADAPSLRLPWFERTCLASIAAGSTISLRSRPAGACAL